MMPELLLKLAERAYLPDFLIRVGIRKLCRQRLSELRLKFDAGPEEALNLFVQRLSTEPVAAMPHLANAQHYEISAEFFKRVLGRNLKYSSCFYDGPHQSLDEAEDAALALTCEHALIRDGQSVLELGCGWGSLTLWIASHYPNTLITGVSNSRSQREFILEHARKRNLSNIEIVTADMNAFDPGRSFDRIVSVEMLEHMRNLRSLLDRIATWLRPDGRFFFHVFCNRDHPYTFDAGGKGDWMAQNFFSGGLMPSRDLLPRLATRFESEATYDWDGTHYARTAEHWLKNQDAHREAIIAQFQADQSKSEARQTFQRWRMFFMACAELFNLNSGKEWGVVHHRLRLAHSPR
jgi:cyclopropane-fatty-acyl-phospholipid synthase